MSKPGADPASGISLGDVLRLPSTIADQSSDKRVADRSTVLAAAHFQGIGEFPTAPKPA